MQPVIFRRDFCLKCLDQTMVQFMAAFGYYTSVIGKHSYTVMLFLGKERISFLLMSPIMKGLISFSVGCVMPSF